MEFLENFINCLSLNELRDYAIFFLIVIFFAVLGPMIAYFLLKVFKLKEKKVKKSAFYKPLKRFLFILGLYIGLKNLILPDTLYIYFDKTFKICIIILTAQALSNLFNSTSNSYKKIIKMFNFTGSTGVANLISKVIIFFIYIIAGFIIVSELGYNLSGLIAGLGLGSVVIALAVQDIAKNILAGFSIITDKPFSIGDFISIDTYVGTVEDISFKSTRIRNLDNQLVIVPNSQIVSASLINHSKIEKRKYHLRITLDLSTPLNKVIAFNDKIKLSLLSDDNIIEDSIKVYFDIISANGIDVVIDFYTTIVEYTEFIKFKEQINFKILEIAEKGKIELAYNSHTIYMKS